MKVWRDKEGRWIDAKEFKERFTKGVQKVSPLQQTQSQLYFTLLTLVGIVGGLVISVIKIKSLWWLGIILLAAFGNTLIGLIGIYQKYIQLKRIKENIEREHLQMVEGGKNDLNGLG